MLGRHNRRCSAVLIDIFPSSGEYCGRLEVSNEDILDDEGK